MRLLVKKLKYLKTLRNTIYLIKVEAELSERMDQLRNMYKREIDSQSQKMEEQKLSSEGIIKTLKDSVASQKAEIEELNM